VIETGLGGRLDSTNVIKPEACGIVSISYDHIAQLGSTLEKIAEEKAGIFKPGVPVISAPQVPAVKRVLRKVAERVGCPLRFIDDIEFSYCLSLQASGPQYAPASRRPPRASTAALLGEHQVWQRHALGIIDCPAGGLGNPHREPSTASLSVSRPDGMIARCRDDRGRGRIIEHRRPDRAIGQNISHDSMAGPAARPTRMWTACWPAPLGADKVIFTTAATARSVDPHELHTRFVEKSQKMAQVGDTLEAAYEIACKSVSREDLICITGSIYLVGLAKRLQAAGKLQ
jgi:dihydrofolate synthase/folylpolyglutamate synthase